MAKDNSLLMIPDEVIMDKILLIRDQKVMIDSDLAELFDVPAKRLNEQVKRNIKRFPPDFLFQLNIEEKEKVVANCGHLRKLKFSPHLPYVFTEHGAVMLANNFKSDRAKQASVRIVEIFIKMREMIQMNKELLLKMEKLEQTVISHDEKIAKVFRYLKKFIEIQEKPRKQVGFEKIINRINPLFPAAKIFTIPATFSQILAACPPECSGGGSARPDKSKAI
jgi:phage regulator Rha-like protein